jgi:hypothetical protein
MSIGAIGMGLNPEMFQCISPGTSQVLTVGAASVQSALPQPGVSIVRLFATVDSWISFGSNPTAVAEGASSLFLPGGIVEYFQISSTEKIAVIQSSTAGKLYITEGANS